MVERKFKKWQLAFIVGLIFIIPMIILFQYTEADITITQLPETTENHCFFKGQPISNGGTIDNTECSYVLSFQSSPFLPVKNFGITIDETEDSWIIRGDCIDTAGESLARFGAEICGHGDPSDNFNPNACRNMVTFDKDKWDRQLILNDIIEQNNFILKDICPSPPQMNIIGG